MYFFSSCSVSFADSSVFCNESLDSLTLLGLDLVDSLVDVLLVTVMGDRSRGGRSAGTELTEPIGMVGEGEKGRLLLSVMEGCEYTDEVSLPESENSTVIPKRIFRTARQR